MIPGGLQRFSVVIALCSVFFYEWYVGGFNYLEAWPECSREDRGIFAKQLGKYASGSPEVLTSKRRELKAECAFAKDYDSARSLFLERALKLRKQNIEATVSGYKVGKAADKENASGVDLVTDYLIVRGSKKKFMITFSGTHGVEGYAGSAVHVSVMDYLLGNKALMNRYTEASVLRDQERLSSGEGDEEGIDEMSLPPTIVIVHIVNPFGMANNRRVNEDNIDLNRNYLNKKLWDVALGREPNHAGYETASFFMNPTRMPTPFLILNDLYDYVMAATVILTMGVEGYKKALLAGNYHNPLGQGYGGKKLAVSAKNMIKLVDEIDVTAAEKVSFVDLHTGLGPSGSDTLALLGSAKHKEKGIEQFNDYLEKSFPVESDPEQPSWWGGRKAITSASRKGGTPMSGYDLTMGSQSDEYCNHFLAPHLAKGNNLVCVTQEFGTLPQVQVGMALRNENFAWNHGTDAEKKLYGGRLKGAFFIQDRDWMRNIVHRGLTVFKQAFTAADSQVLA